MYMYLPITTTNYSFCWRDNTISRLYQSLLCFSTCIISQLPPGGPKKIYIEKKKVSFFFPRTSAKMELVSKVQLCSRSGDYADGCQQDQWSGFPKGVTKYVCTLPHATSLHLQQMVQCTNLYSTSQDLELQDHYYICET